jgi:hypothetical protein
MSRDSANNVPGHHMVDPGGRYSNSWQQIIAQFRGLVTDMRHDT